MKKHILSVTIAVAVSLPLFMNAQTTAQQIDTAENLHKKFEFGKAIEIYNSLIAKTADSTERIAIENKLILSENGLSLMEYAGTPVVVASKPFNASTFFLHYSGFADSSWVKIPKNLLNGVEPTGGYPYMQYSEYAETLVYSVPDEKGKWSIFSIHRLNDTLWSAPAIMNDNVTSAGNDIFPVISRDGKQLFFSSNGHYGMGGYDLYVSTRDERTGDWGIPQNLGIPYSSPMNDYLFYDTPDGNFSILASDRESRAGELRIYALRFENMPLKKSVTPAEALELSKLKVIEQQNEENEEVRKTDSTGIGEKMAQEYTVAVENVKRVRDRLDSTLMKQQNLRELYNTLTNTDDLAALEKKIAEMEIEAIARQNDLGEATKRLQDIEMEFLAKGIFMTGEHEKSAEEESKTENGKALPVFRFAENHMGPTPNINAEKPEKRINLEFTILDETDTIWSDSFVPDGLIYQIQIFTLSRKISGVKALKGLSPVFERRLGTGYSYTAGAFRTYTEATKALSAVKKRGFTTAVIKAYENNKSITVSQARIKEKNAASNATYQVVINGYEVLPQELLTAIRSSTEKDIAKGTENGLTTYIVGPFAKEDEATSLAEVLKSISDKVINVEKTEK